MLDGFLIVACVLLLAGWIASGTYLWQERARAQRSARRAVHRARQAEALLRRAADMEIGAPRTADEQRLAFAATLAWQRDATAWLAARRNGHSTRRVPETVEVG